jgi:hypothetical protein
MTLRLREKDPDLETTHLLPEEKDPDPETTHLLPEEKDQDLETTHHLLDRERDQDLEMIRLPERDLGLEMIRLLERDRDQEMIRKVMTMKKEPLRDLDSQQETPLKAEKNQHRHSMKMLILIFFMKMLLT